MFSQRKTRIWLAAFMAVFILTACNPKSETAPAGESGKLQVVATTTLVGDVVAQVGDDLIELHVLLPVGSDPHSFDPTPQDIAKVADADIVFANGAGLEKFLDTLIESAGATERVVSVSDGIDLRTFENAPPGHDEPPGTDPHTWVDPNNVMVWVDNIERALADADSAHAADYAANAENYRQQLTELDTWIREQVAQIPPENRKLVTDHTLFGYFADEYGFEQVGALIPGYSTLAEPSAQELAAIEDAIREYGVPAIFVGNTVNPALAERVAEDTGTQLVTVYTGSLSGPDGDAPTYLDYMRYNVSAFVDALK